MRKQGGKREMSEGNKPEIRIRCGAIGVTVWKNTLTKKSGEEAEYNTVSFERRYMEKESGEWKSTNSMRVNDLPKAVMALQKAYEYLVLKEDRQEVVAVAATV